MSRGRATTRTAFSATGGLAFTAATGRRWCGTARRRWRWICPMNGHQAHGEGHGKYQLIFKFHIKCCYRCGHRSPRRPSRQSIRCAACASFVRGVLKFWKPDMRNMGWLRLFPSLPPRLAFLPLLPNILLPRLGCLHTHSIGRYRASLHSAWEMGPACPRHPEACLLHSVWERGPAYP